MNELLEIAVKAHGGLEVWRAIRTIEVKASLSGELLRIKGHPKILMDVSFHRAVEALFKVDGSNVKPLQK